MTTVPHPEALLRQLEEDLLRLEVRRSAEAVGRLLAEDFVEFGASGRAYDRQAIIAALAAEQPVARSISDFQARPLAPAVYLVTYRASRAEPADALPRMSLRASIWAQIDGRWQLVFHQGTPII